MASRFRRALDHFFITTKKGYDEYYWIFVIVAGAGVITKIFGVAGFGASVLAFLLFYMLGRAAMRREKRLARERAQAKK
jgi:hypothetical protein